MAEDKHFQFGGTDEIKNGPLFQKDILNRRIERLNRTVTIIIVLLTCLFGLLLYYGYRDLSKRVSRSQNSGVQEVKQLSEEVQQFGEDVQQLGKDVSIKFNWVSATLDELKAGLSEMEKSLQDTRTLLNQKTTASESANANLASSTRANTESIKQLDDALAKLKTTKLDKADFGEIDAKLNAALAPLNKQIETLAALKEEIEALAPLREEIDSLPAFRQEIEDVSGRLSALENSLGKDLNAFAAYVEKTNEDLVKIQSSITALSKDKISQETLRLELLKAGKINRLVLLQEVTKIQKTLHTIQDRVYKLERISPRSSSNIRTPSRDQKQATLSRSNDVSEKELTD